MPTISGLIKPYFISLFSKFACDSDGFLKFPVLAGPAKGLRFQIRMSAGEFSLLTGSYERDELEASLAICRPGSTVWDCGTHIGFFTAAFARAVGKDGAVIGFEPDPYSRGRAEANLRLNQLSNASIHGFAVGAPSGTVSFVTTGNQTSHLLGTYVGGKELQGVEKPKSDDVIEVQCISPNEALEKYGFPAPDIIKLDLEGAEVDALAHIDQVIAATRPILVVEVHNPDAEVAVLQFAKRCGYAIQSLVVGEAVTDHPVPRHVVCRPIGS